MKYLSAGKKYVLMPVILICLVFTLNLAVKPVQTNAADSSEGIEKQRTIQLSGQGSVNAVPDIAYITLGVVTENENANTAQVNNAELMSGVVDAIKAAGVGSSDIQTINYSISPKYTYNKDTNENILTGYSVSNTVRVTVRDISKTGSIIDTASKSGANVSNSISFGLSDYEKYYNEALEKAIQSAVKRAEIMAKPLGITLGMPVNITENGGYSPPVYYFDYSSYGMKSNAAAVTTPVSSGSLEVKASVSMTYEY